MCESEIFMYMLVEYIFDILQDVCAINRTLFCTHVLHVHTVHIT